MHHVSSTANAVTVAILAAVLVLYGCGGGGEDGAPNRTATPESANPPATADATPPTTPGGLAATALSSSRINLSWSDSKDNVAVTGYRVFRAGNLLTTLGNVTTFQDTGLAGATMYTYSVQAVDAAGNASLASADAGATTLPVNTATLAWDAVAAPSLIGYRVYYGNASGTYLQPLGSGIDVGNVTTYVVTNLSTGTRYYFAVTAYDASNESEYSNEVFKDIP